MPFDSAALRSGRTVHTWHLWAHLRPSFLRRQEPSAPAHQALPVIPANSQRGRGQKPIALAHQAFAVIPAKAGTQRPCSSSFARHSCEPPKGARAETHRPRSSSFCRHSCEGRNPMPLLMTNMKHWIPAFAGMTSWGIPAFAGMTSSGIPANTGMTSRVTGYSGCSLRPLY